MDSDDEEVSPAVDYLGTDDDPRVDLDSAQEAMWAHETEKIKHLAVASDQGELSSQLFGSRSVHQPALSELP